MDGKSGKCRRAGRLYRNITTFSHVLPQGGASTTKSTFSTCQDAEKKPRLFLFGGAGMPLGIALLELSVLCWPLSGQWVRMACEDHMQAAATLFRMQRRYP